MGLRSEAIGVKVLSAPGGEEREGKCPKKLSLKKEISPHSDAPGVEKTELFRQLCPEGGNHLRGAEWANSGGGGGNVEIAGEIRF